MTDIANFDVLDFLADLAGQRCLGAKRSTPAAVANKFQLAQFTTPTFPTAPSTWDGTLSTPKWFGLGNNHIGDCAPVAALHGQMLFEHESGNDPNFTPLLSDAIAAYSAIGGYNPNVPGTDNGCTPNGVLSYWRKTGMIGRKIDAYAGVNQASVPALQSAASAFGGLFLPLGLPKSCRNQKIWTPLADLTSPKAQPWSWGGHLAWLAKYDADLAYVVTWGKLKPVTWDFIRLYGFEVTACLGGDWISRVTHLSPTGFDMAALQAKLAALGAVP